MAGALAEYLFKRDPRPTDWGHRPKPPGYLFKPDPRPKDVWRSPASYTPEEMEEFRRIKEDFLRKGYANLGIPYNPNADAEIGESGLTKESVLREAYRILGIRRKHNPGADEED